MATNPDDRKEALGKNLRLKPGKSSERQYLDAMGLLSGQASLQPAQDFTVDMRSFNEHTLSGKYHVFRIKNKFPVPGGAVADDFYRRKLIEQNASRAKLLRERAEKRDYGQEIAGRAFDKQQQLALPSTIERLVIEADKAISDHDLHKQEAVETLQGHVGDTAEVRRIFGLIRSRNVTELERLFLTGEISVNMVEPALLYSGLILAASYGLLTTVRQYLSHGANPNLRTSSGYTALHTAWDAWLKVNPNIPKKEFQKQATISMVKELLRYKADPNIQTSEGTTPLHMACQYGHEVLVIEMLKYGADRSLKDKSGRTAADIALEKCDKGHADRRGCVGILKNWDIICAKQASTEFASAWRLAMETTNQYASAMANQAKQGGGNIVPHAGVIDVTARGGADAPLIAAANHTEEVLWGKSEDVDTMLHNFSVQERILDYREAKQLETLSFNRHVPSLPTLAEVRTRSGPSQSHTLDNSKLPVGVDPRASAAHKKRLKAQWDAANAPEAAAEDVAARHAIFNQATALSNERRCARLDKIAPNEDRLLQDVIAVADQREMAKLQRIKHQNAKKRGSIVSQACDDDLSHAEKAVRALKSRLKTAAHNMLDDAKTGVEVHAPSGEHFIRRTALDSAILRPSRFRIDNRQLRRATTAKQEIQSDDDSHSVSVASMNGVPSPSLAIDRSALEARKAATAAPEIGADKAEIEANRQKQKEFLEERSLLPARGSYADQIQQKRDRLKEEKISNEFIGKAPPEGYHERVVRESLPIERKLEGEANDLHYGNPQELFTPSEKPPSHGVLHAGGSINAGHANSLMGLSTLDISQAAHKEVVQQVGNVLGVVPRAQPAQYGIRRAVQYEGGEMPSFAESQQQLAWKKGRVKNLYDEVEASKKQWYKSSSLFGRPEEPWLNGGVAAPSDSQPEHNSSRPPKGFKRIRNGQVVYL